MPVRGEGLLYVLSALLIWYTPTLIGRVIVSVILIIWYLKYHAHSTIWYILFLLFACWWIQDDLIVHQTTDVIQVTEIQSSYVIGQDENQRYILYGLEDVGLDDIVKVKGKAKKIHSLQNFYGFSFEKWCERRKITTQIQVEDRTVLQEGSSIRHLVYEHIQSFPKETKEFVLSFIFGISEKQDDLSYLMKAAGFHISALFLCLRKLCERIGFKHNRIISFILGFLLVSIGRESASINRILVFEFVSCLPITHRKDRFAFSILTCVLLFPYQLYEYGFILACIIRFVSLFDMGKRKLRYFLPLLLIPFQLFAFYECDIFQVLCFNWYRKLFSFAYLYSWLLVAFPFLGIGVSLLTQVLEILPTNLLVWSGKPYLIWMIMWLSVCYRVMHEIKRKHIIQLITLLMILPFQSYLNPFGEVMMIDVGQGDCFLVSLPFHKGTMMIDVAGSLYKNIPESTIYPILKAKGIKAIDVLVISHEDYDHSGGLEELSKMIEIKKIIKKYQLTIDLGPAQFQVIQDPTATEDRNDQSLVVYGRLGKHAYLFMGDAGIQVEEYIMSKYPLLTCDVLKLGHHGSNTSSSSAFLQQLSPQLALISAGKDNRYHHPSKEVINRLEDYQIYYETSAETGAVSIYFTPWFSFFVNASHEFGFLK